LGEAPEDKARNLVWWQGPDPSGSIAIPKPQRQGKPEPRPPSTNEQRASEYPKRARGPA